MSARASLAALAPEAVTAKQQGKANGSNAASKSKGKEKEVEPESSAGSGIVKEETAIGKVVRDSKKITVECNHGLM